MFDAQEYPFDQHIEGVIPFLLLNVPHRADDAANTGVVKEDVEATEHFHSAIDHGLDIGFRGDIDLDEVCSVAMSGVRRQRHGFAAVGGVEISDHDFRALGEETQNSGLPDAARAARYYSDLVRKFHSSSPD